MLTGLGILAYYSLVPPEQETITYVEPQPEKPKNKYEVGKPTAQEMLELVNKERTKRGIKPLKRDANVEKSAQLKADDFVKRNYYDHIVKGTKYTLTPEMAMYVNRSCSFSSENIVASRLTSQSSIDAWMESTPHRKAILDPKYSLTGFGVAESPISSDYYAVQHFCIAK